MQPTRMASRPWDERRQRYRSEEIVGSWFRPCGQPNRVKRFDDGARSIMHPGHNLQETGHSALAWQPV